MGKLRIKHGKLGLSHSCFCCPRLGPLDRGVTGCRYHRYHYHWPPKKTSESCLEDFFWGEGAAKIINKQLINHC